MTPILLHLGFHDRVEPCVKGLQQDFIRAIWGQVRHPDAELALLEQVVAHRLRGRVVELEPDRRVRVGNNPKIPLVYHMMEPELQLLQMLNQW